MSRLITGRIPARHGRARNRALGVPVALLLLMPLSACADGGFTLPSGDELKQFTADAQRQIDTIGSDLGDLAGQLGKFPEAVRGTTQDALDKSRDAAERAQSALDDAKNARAGAEEALNRAGSDVEAAKKKVGQALDQLKDKTDPASAETRQKLEDLRKQLDGLEERIGS